MKTYKLNGLEYYTCAFTKEEAVLIFISNKIGITTYNIHETDIKPNRDAIERVFKSLEDYINFKVI